MLRRQKSKEELREKENLKKRDEFYENIKLINFDFNADEFYLTTFIPALRNESSTN